MATDGPGQLKGRRDRTAGAASAPSTTSGAANPLLMAPAARQAPSTGRDDALGGSVADGCRNADRDAACQRVITSRSCSRECSRRCLAAVSCIDAWLNSGALLVRLLQTLAKCLMDRIRCARGKQLNGCIQYRRTWTKSGIAGCGGVGSKPAACACCCPTPGGPCQGKHFEFVLSACNAAPRALHELAGNSKASAVAPTVGPSRRACKAKQRVGTGALTVGAATHAPTSVTPCLTSSAAFAATLSVARCTPATASAALPATEAAPCLAACAARPAAHPAALSAPWTARLPCPAAATAADDAALAASPTVPAADSAAW